MSSLSHRERPAAGDPEGLLVLHHGRGADEHDLLGLAGERPTPAGILAFSGFIPTVDGWQPDLGSRPDPPVFITHGRRNPIMDVQFARQANALLDGAGLPVEYHESDAAHHVDPAHVPAAVQWLDRTIPAITTATAAAAQEGR